MRLIKHPVLCNYYVTYRCNASCSFCDIWEKPSPYVTMKEVEENLRALKRLGVKVIDFTGGEPLLHREIDQFLKLAKDLGFITTLTTNTLLYPKWAHKLKGLVDMLHFSLDFAEKSKHDTARGVACFDSVLASIQLAKEIGERPDILFTVFDDNIADIETVYEQIIVPNGLLMILNPVFSYGKEVGSSLSTSHFTYLRKIARKSSIYLNDGFLKLREDGGNKISSPICKAASSTIVISPENKLITPCYHLGTKAFNIDNNLDSLFKSKDVQAQIALEGKLPECEGCVINCYMQPSFAVELNRYWLAALPSTLKYNRVKGTWKQLFA